MSAAQACIVQNSAEFGMHRRTVRGTPAAARAGGRVGMLGEGPHAFFAEEEGSHRAREHGRRAFCRILQKEWANGAAWRAAASRRAPRRALWEAARYEDQASATAGGARGAITACSRADTAPSI